MVYCFPAVNPVQLSSQGNANISRSRGWQAQPINHDGLTLSGSADVVDLMIGVVNNFTVADQQIAMNDVDDEKGIIGSMGIGVSDELSIYVSGIFTEEGDTVDVAMANLIISGNLDAGDSGVSYAIEGNWRENDPHAASLGAVEMKNVTAYVGCDASPVGVDLRLAFTDDEGITTPIDTKVWSLTVTGSIPLTDGVDFRVEYRHDDADDPIFADGGTSDDSLDIIQAQLVWHPNM